MRLIGDVKNLEHLRATFAAAVNPTNVMGASKRAAQMVISHLWTLAHATRFSVTHPDITRYFMTTPEAARLVLQAAALAESGQVYVLDMGEAARALIRLSGHREDEIGIVFSGLRPGTSCSRSCLRMRTGRFRRRIRGCGSRG